MDQHTIREQIRKLTAKLESMHLNPNKHQSKLFTKAAVWRASRDVFRRQLLQIKAKATYEKI